MNDAPQQSTATRPAMSPELNADYCRWLEKQAAKKERMNPTSTFDEVRARLRASLATLPDRVEIPPDQTPEGERMTRFRKVCDAEFLAKIDRTQLTNPAAFDRVALWDGSFPGPLAVGGTGASKTRGAWSALGRLWVRENRPFAWFPVKRLVTEFERYESRELLDEFWRNYSPPRFRVLFVDDVDKINWDFESQPAALFQFYDWVYRAQIPCITTTNRSREWWNEKAGAAFVRRLFDEAHQEVKF